MKKLENDFTRGKREFHSLFKNERINVYQVTMTYSTNEKDIFIEVFKPKICKADIYHTDSYEKYPKDNEFGKRAWTITTMGSLNKILKNEFQLSNEEINEISQICNNVF